MNAASPAPSSPAASSPLLVLAGPTGSGKSEVALSLARRIGGAIVSADSMQVYRGLAIGTAQPSPEEMAEIPHRLVGHVDPRDRYDAARFVADAEAALAELRAAGRTPIIVGGTGMYLRSLLDGLFEGPSRDAEVRRRLDAEAEALGPEALHRRLGEIDPESAARILPRDRVRIVRALEVHEITGRTISWWQAESRRHGPRHEARFVVADRERGDLYARIDRRVERMLGAGWIDEVRRLLAEGIPPEAPAFRALGYNEILMHLRGELDRAALSSAMARASRQYARRQIIWFRAVRNAAWVQWTGLDAESAADAVLRAWN